MMLAVLQDWTSSSRKLLIEQPLFGEESGVSLIP